MFIVFVWSITFSGLVVAQTSDDVVDGMTNEQNEENQNDTGSVSDESLLYNIPKVDQAKVEAAWLDRINTEREKIGVDPYKIDDKLTKTSIIWAIYLADNNKFRNMHQRIGCPQSRCTPLIQKWFNDNGVDTTVVTESVGYGGYSCKKEDCTDDLILASKKRFDGLFMREKRGN